jgi:hypothetical protein
MSYPVTISECFANYYPFSFVITDQHSIIDTNYYPFSFVVTDQYCVP